jgi:chromosome segregation ATPase
MICCQCSEFMDDAYLTEARGEYVCLNCHIDELDKQLAAKDRELADSVPRSRVAAMEVEIQAEKDKLAMVQESCGKEIRDLWYKLSSAQQEVNQYADDRSELSRQLASALAEISRLTADVELLTKQRADWKALATADAGHQQENVRLKSELEKCKLQSDKLREGLRKLEWVDGRRENCPACGNLNPIAIGSSIMADEYVSHKPNFWLAALLKETE